MARLALELYLFLEIPTLAAAVHDRESSRMLWSEQHVLSVAIDRKGIVRTVSAADQPAATGMASAVPPGTSVASGAGAAAGSDLSTVHSSSAPTPMPVAAAGSNGAAASSALTSPMARKPAAAGYDASPLRMTSAPTPMPIVAAGGKPGSAATSALGSPTAVKTATEGVITTVQAMSNAATTLADTAIGISVGIVSSAQTSSTPPIAAMDTGGVGVVGSAQTSLTPPTAVMGIGGQPTLLPGTTLPSSAVAVGSQTGTALVNSTVTTPGSNCTDDQAKSLATSITRKVLIMMVFIVILLVGATILARHLR